MPVGIVKAGSYNSVFGSDYHSYSKELLTWINISTGMTPKDLAKLQSVHAVILSVFPLPIWNFELNTKSSILLWPICTEKVFIILKEDDLLVLRVPEIQGSFNRSKDRFPLAVNILVCDVSHLLLLWISWFVVSYLLLLWPICTEKVFIILKEDDLLVLRVLEIQGSFNRSKDGFPLAVNILVCDVSHLLLLWYILVWAVSYMLLLWISWFVVSYLLLLWPICTEKVFIILKEDDLLVLRVPEIQGSFNRSKDGFPLAVNILVCDVSHLLLLWYILVWAVRYLLLLWISWFVVSYLLLLWPVCTEKVFIILKEDDLLVLRVLEIQGVL